MAKGRWQIKICHNRDLDGTTHITAPSSGRIRHVANVQVKKKVGERHGLERERVKVQRGQRSRMQAETAAQVGESCQRGDDLALS